MTDRHSVDSIDPAGLAAFIRDTAGLPVVEWAAGQTTPGPEDPDPPFIVVRRA